MTHRRSPQGTIPENEIPHALETELPQFHWWALAAAVSCGIWGLLCWIGKWFVSLF